MLAITTYTSVLADYCEFFFSVKFLPVSIGASGWGSADCSNGLNYVLCDIRNQRGELSFH